MAGISQELYGQIREQLLDCDALYDADQLRALFAVAELHPFRGRLKTASSGGAQADLLISNLVDSQRATGENALVLFLQVLARSYDPADAHHTRLLELADQLQNALAGDTPVATATPAQSETPDQRAALRKLREALAYLYDDENSARLIVDDAGLPIAQVRFGGSAIDNWYNILKEAEKQNKLVSLVERASADYPTYQPLNEARQALLAAAPAAPETPARGRHVVPISPSSTQPTAIQHRYALLVGVRDYVDPNFRPLPHTVHDVTALEQVLLAAGYTVRCLHSDQTDDNLKPTRDNIWGELENLTDQTGPGDLLLVHFGGHGYLHEGKAYLIPSQTRRSSLQRTAIDLDEFTAALAKAPAQARILFLDACHTGIGRSATGMDPEFEQHIYLEAEGAATLAACRQLQVAYEHHQSPHGAFTYYLLEGLRGAAGNGQRFITFTNVNHYVTDQVKRWAIGRGLQQTPNASTHLVGDPPLLEL